MPAHVLAYVQERSFLEGRLFDRACLFAMKSSSKSCYVCYVLCVYVRLMIRVCTTVGFSSRKATPRHTLHCRWLH